MPRPLMVLGMLAVTAAATLYAALRAYRVAESKEDPGSWLVGLTGAVGLVNLILLMNAASFIEDAEIMAAQMDLARPVLGEQLLLLGGTAGLMMLTASVVDAPAVREAPDPGTAVGRLYTAMIERLLVRFWWAALGFGILFGTQARGAALFLAVELTIIWIAGRVMARRRESPGQAS